MLIDISMPSTIGVFRAKVSEAGFSQQASEITPPSTPPMKPQMAGTEAMRPAFRIDMPRCWTR